MLALPRGTLPCAPPRSASSSRRPAPLERLRVSRRLGAVVGCAPPRLVFAPDAGRPRGPSPTPTARRPECHRCSRRPRATAGPDLLAEEEACVPAPSMNPAAVDPVTAPRPASARLLLLKLDYEDILAAWADCAPLYIGDGADAPGPQEIDAMSAGGGGAVRACGGCVGRDGGGGGGRAERVRRYKEKRRNRLFAKRIRYEVRRVNAIKRT
ncbi:hypothetical protein BS78_01G098200 [Paspalum vaginatum]|nr:hypothetical protein BS78_01G098200 [Paspalum vaginatum]